jgi:hypothetical protein
MSPADSAARAGDMTEASGDSSSGTFDIIMNPWIPIVVLSLIAGAVCGFAVRGRLSLLIAALIPWFGVLAWLLYSEYFVPYQGGGASMWPVAQLFAGSAAAAIGLCAAAVVRAIRNRA